MVNIYLHVYIYISSTPQSIQCKLLGIPFSCYVSSLNHTHKHIHTCHLYRIGLFDVFVFVCYVYADARVMLYLQIYVHSFFSLNIQHYTLQSFILRSSIVFCFLAARNIVVIALVACVHSELIRFFPSFSFTLFRSFIRFFYIEIFNVKLCLRSCCWMVLFFASSYFSSCCSYYYYYSFDDDLFAATATFDETATKVTSESTLDIQNDR